MKSVQPLDLPDLIDIFRNHRGYLVDKWEQYLAVYTAEFARFQESGLPVRLLEIGVQNGGSLEIWAKFLPPGSSIVGIDIDPACASLRFGGDIAVLIADAADEAALNCALGDRVFDIIIDDASHRSPDIISTFRSTFHRVVPGGLYIVEDLHAAYWAAYGGGFRAAGSAIEWFKDLVDSMHVDYFESPGLLANEELAQLRTMNHEIARMSFCDSIVVVERFSKAEFGPWRRLVSGSDAHVTPGMAPNVEDIEMAQGENMFLGAAAAVARRRTQDQAHLAEMKACLASTEMQLVHTKAALDEAIAAGKREHAYAQAIVASRIWRATAPLRCVVDWFRGRR